MNTTELENKVLVSMLHNHYGDEGSAVWAWAHNDSTKPHGLPKATVSGVISSLCKKGLMWSNEDGRDSTIGLTDEGRKIAKTL